MPSFVYHIIAKEKKVYKESKTQFTLLFFFSTLLNKYIISTTKKLQKMKFTLATISAALMAVSTVSGAAIINKRASDPQTMNETLSQYPNTTDIGALNGTCK